MNIVFCVDLGMLVTFLGSSMYPVTWQVWSEKKRWLGIVMQFLLKSNIINFNYSKKN